MRHPLVMGNWKLNGSRHIVNELVISPRKELTGVAGCAVTIAPPEMHIGLTRHTATGNRTILGVQNIDLNLSDVLTGGTSVEMLKDVGAQYIIVGHSERRTCRKESNELITKEFAVLKEQGLTPVLYISGAETGGKAGKTEEVCVRQTDVVLKVQGAAAFEDVVIAYEPVWAIGTGKSATPAQTQVVHKFIRDHIAKADAKIAKQIIIRYGGSVNAANVTELFAQPDIDGMLASGASLKADAFTATVKAAETAKQA